MKRERLGRLAKLWTDMPATLRTEDQRHRPMTDNGTVGRYAVRCIRDGYRWFPDEATKCQGFVASALRKGGFKVTWEVDIARADGRPGRIDLVAGVSQRAGRN